MIFEGYFKSKWPLIELHSFKQASVENQMLKIRPLFLGFALCKQKSYKVWANTNEVADQIEVDERKQSLKLMVPFNGLVYGRAPNEVVSCTCIAIPRDIKLDELHIQGHSKLC